MSTQLFDLLESCIASGRVAMALQTIKDLCPRDAQAGSARALRRQSVQMIARLNALQAKPEAQRQEQLARVVRDMITEARDIIIETQVPASVVNDTCGYLDRAMRLRDTAPASAGLPRNAIFISYRRADSGTVTGMIYTRLGDEFGRNAVFIDVNSIRIGIDFRSEVVGVLGNCRACLVVIGPDWVNAGKKDTGRRRLDDTADLVRIEIEAALRSGMPVVPLFVEGAQMPPASELPETIVPLAYRSGQAIRAIPDFDNDMSRLVLAIRNNIVI